MPDLPARFAGLILAFAPLFVHRSWRHAQMLLIGAILTLILPHVSGPPFGMAFEPGGRIDVEKTTEG